MIRSNGGDEPLAPLNTGHEQHHNMHMALCQHLCARNRARNTAYCTVSRTLGKASEATFVRTPLTLSCSSAQTCNLLHHRGFVMTFFGPFGEGGMVCQIPSCRLGRKFRDAQQHREQRSEEHAASRSVQAWRACGRRRRAYVLSRAPLRTSPVSRYGVSQRPRPASPAPERERVPPHPLLFRASPTLPRARRPSSRPGPRASVLPLGPLLLLLLLPVTWSGQHLARGVCVFRCASLQSCAGGAWSVQQ